MKMRKSNIVLVGLLLAGASLWAQTKDKKQEKPKPKPIPVYLGRSEITDGAKLTKRAFDSLLRQGLTAKDSVGNPYKVEGFAFTYGERNLYEDSVGNQMWVTDHLVEYNFGDTLSTFLLNNITGRSKGGDTVYIDNITLRSDTRGGALGRALRLVLQK